MNANHVLFLINGNKGMDEKEKAMQQVLPSIGAHFPRLTVQQTFSQEEIIEICQSSAKYDLLIVYGGDGTVHLVINEIAKLEKAPTVAILPGGTCNDFSRVLRIPQNLKKAAQNIINGNVQPIDLASINDHYFLNFAGVGLIADTSENIDDHLKESFGKLSYFLSAIQQFQQNDSIHFEIEMDGQTIHEEAVMLLVMNGFFIGTHQFPILEISVQDGKLDLIVVKESNLQTVREWFTLAYRNDDVSSIQHYQGRDIVIRTKEAKDVDTDGEIYLQTPIHIRVIPKKVNLIVGQDFIES